MKAYINGNLLNVDQIHCDGSISIHSVVAGTVEISRGFYELEDYVYFTLYKDRVFRTRNFVDFEVYCFGQGFKDSSLDIGTVILYSPKFEEAE